MLQNTDWFEKCCSLQAGECRAIDEIALCLPATWSRTLKPVCTEGCSEDVVDCMRPRLPLRFAQASAHCWVLGAEC